MKPTQFRTPYPQGVGIPGGDPALPEGQPVTDCCDDETPDRALEQTVFYGYLGDVLTLVQSTSNQGASSITFDDPPTPGHLLFAAFTVRAITGTITTPTGWTLVDDPASTGSNSGQSWLWYKVAEVGESDTFTVAAATNHRRLAVAEFAGAGVLLDTQLDDDQAAASSYPIGPVDVLANALLVGLTQVSSAGVTFTDDADFDTIASGQLDDSFGPSDIFSHRTVGPGSWTWTPTSGTNDTWAGVLAAFGSGAAWLLAGPEVTDGDDATYITVEGEDVLRIDLGAAFEIASTRILIATETAGARTYTLRGANVADFSDAVSIATLGFTATGSFTTQVINASWVATDAYQYWELTGDDETRRVHSWELYEAASLTPEEVAAIADDVAALEEAIDGHLTDATDAHDASAVSIVDAGGHFTGTDVEAALQELGASGLTVEELDGSPTDAAVTKIVFPIGTLDIVSHVATYTPIQTASELGTWNYNRTRGGTPLNKGLRLAANIAVGTPNAVHIDDEDISGSDRSPYLAQLAAGDSMFIDDGAGNIARATIISAPVDHSGWWEFPFTPSGAYPMASEPANGANVRFGWQTAGSGTGAAAGGVGPLLIDSAHSVPIVFGDILQASDGSDLLYGSP